MLTLPATTYESGTGTHFPTYHTGSKWQNPARSGPLTIAQSCFSQRLAARWFYAETQIHSKHKHTPSVGSINSSLTEHQLLLVHLLYVM